MSLIGFILMIFTSVLVLRTARRRFYLPGIAQLRGIFSALLFFIPFALICAEMGSAYRKRRGVYLACG